MAGTPRITLEQWRALQAVVEAGGYAQAAEALHKSQSTVTYAVQKIQRLLDVELFAIRGRKAVLTESGEVLYRRARMLLEEAAALERGAAEMASDWQPEIRLAVETLFPTWLLLEALAEFGRERPETRIEVYETVLEGTGELLKDGRVDIAIGSLPAGVEGKQIGMVRFVPVASPAHPLHKLGRPLTERDLRRHRRILIRDTSTQRRTEVSGVELRWTMSHKATSIRAIKMGLGFAWLPEETIRTELEEGSLKRLPLRDASDRVVPINLALAEPEFPSRDTLRLAEILRNHAARCGGDAPRRGGRSPAFTRSSRDEASPSALRNARARAGSSALALTAAV
jgi:DNA-binding transcriptional LysR family regulator